MYQLIIMKRALKMAQQAFEWYENEQNGLGEVFIDALNATYMKILNRSESFSAVEQYYRQIKMQRFPYVVLYEIEKKKIVVYAVFHTSRNPTQRLKGKA